MAGDEDRTEVVVDTRVDFPNTGRVMSVTVRLVPPSEQFPDGVKYSMHYGDYDGSTVVRYDNAHGATKGHERHTGDDVEEIEFPGWRELLARFRTEVLEHERGYTD